MGDLENSSSQEVLRAPDDEVLSSPHATSMSRLYHQVMDSIPAWFFNKKSSLGSDAALHRYHDETLDEH